ncbi:ribosomal protein S5 domain 2-type protein [Naematelia encephala]|uniref:Ribosomal RNA-processing protein 42 n=1 Tax=Naematelia encephala TaxID=71784 RepID=A0A1Y2ANN9_9TREE|nr:ribosomal protein S5 domain 2-type protein [Naematelia encephala]
MATSLSPAERSYIISGLSHKSTPTRLDGRSLLEPRPIEVSYGDAPHASGSARVTIEGGTEVIAGVRLEVGDVDATSSGAWRCQVEVDVTPQAYPSLSSQSLSQLSTLYASLLSDHFVPSLPPLPILPPTKYFIPHLQLTVLSAAAAAVPTALALAARAAFCDLKIPKTKRIGWEGAEVDATTGEGDLAGIKAAVKAGRGRGKARRAGGGDDWDLDLDGEGVEALQAREELPVLVTLNLVPGSEKIFLDATAQEEAACTDRLHIFFTGGGKVCGMRIEGPDGFDAARIRPLLLEGRRIATELISSLNAQIPK